jgi:hypothetical protein
VRTADYRLPIIQVNKSAGTLVVARRCIPQRSIAIEKKNAKSNLGCRQIANSNENQISCYNLNCSEYTLYLELDKLDQYSTVIIGDV